MSVGYTWEKLYNAVLILVSSDTPLLHRLAGAYQAMHMLTPEDFPDEDLRAAYTTLVQGLCLGDNGQVHGTRGPLHTALCPHHAGIMAETLLRLYTDLTRLEEQHYRALSRRDQ